MNGYFWSDRWNHFWGTTINPRSSYGWYCMWMDLYSPCISWQQKPANNDNSFKEFPL